MHVDPALSAYAADRPLMAEAQDRVHRAAAGWRAKTDVARVLADCDGWARGGSFECLSGLGSIQDRQAATAFAQVWIDAMTAAMRATQMAPLPFRHSSSAGIEALELHRTGGTSLSLVLIQPAAVSPSRSITFTDCERHEIVLAGSGRALAFSDAGQSAPSMQEFALKPGTRFSADASHSRAIVSLDAPLVLLRLAREPDYPEATREIEIATGRVLHRSSASPTDGRAELAAAILGAMGRVDAARPLADYACGQAGEGARWQALRNALALDTAAGFAALQAIARRRSDPVQPDARALLDRLCTTYPQLAKMRDEPCLAS